MPRMRETMRSGRNGSSASYFSPTPTNFTGAPVTLRIESAAPPRASPSSLGEDHAGDAEALVEFAGGTHGVLPDHGVGDEENLGGIEFRLSVESSFISSSSMCSRPAVSTRITSQAESLASRSRAANDFERLVGAGAGPDRRASSFGDLGELFAGGRTVNVRRDDDRAVTMFARAICRVSRWKWSCRNLAGRR